MQVSFFCTLIIVSEALSTN